MARVWIASRAVLFDWYRQFLGRVETKCVSHTWSPSSNRTCRFPASGFPDGFIMRAIEEWHASTRVSDPYVGSESDSRTSRSVDDKGADSDV